MQCHSATIDSYMWTTLRQTYDRMSPSLWAFCCAILFIWASGCERKPAGASTRSVLPAQIRVLTWNLHRCEAGVDRIEDELISHRPDLLFLQEAEVANDAAATESLLPRLAAALGGFEIVSPHALKLPPDQHCDVAILSRWPIRSVAAHSLEPKGWVYAIEGLISTDAGDVTLMSVHTHATWRLTDIAHVRESTEVRRRQIDAIIARATALAHPAIVAGDFNASTGTVDAERLTTSLTDLALPSERRPTTPAALPVLRLDYIFANRAMTVVSFETIKVNMSDHRPVLAVINIPSSLPS